MKGYRSLAFTRSVVHLAVNITPNRSPRCRPAARCRAFRTICPGSKRILRAPRCKSLEFELHQIKLFDFYSTFIPGSQFKRTFALLWPISGSRGSLHRRLTLPEATLCLPHSVLVFPVKDRDKTSVFKKNGSKGTRGTKFSALSRSCKPSNLPSDTEKC